MTYLLDTEVFIELVRPVPSAGVVRWMSEQSSVAISAITVEELWCAVTSKPNARVQLWLEEFLETFCSVLAVTPPIARHAGVMRAQFARRGRVRSNADLLIAATAAANGLNLATRNDRELHGCGVMMHNPFK